MKKIVFLVFAITLMMTFTIIPALAYNQSPVLDQLVKDGKLPPVDERLPENPKVVKVTEEIGQYGGTLRLVHSWVGADPQLRMINTEFMLESYPFPGFDASKMEPNVLEDYTVSEDGKKFTFTLRKGMQWSDGYPVTTEDVRYLFEDVLGNEELTPVFPSFLKRGGKRVDFKVIDDYTFSLEFAVPYGLFPLMLQSHGNGPYMIYMLPSHYMKKYHIKYTPLEEMQADLKEEGLESNQWAELHNSKNGSSGWALDAEIGFPTLFPYYIAERPSSSVTILKRNPYYFKVDAEGNQLPYIDEIRMELIQDQEMKNMKIMSGEVDFEGGAGGLPLSNLALYKENESKGNYNTLVLDPTTINTPVCYFLNMTNEEMPELASIMRDKRFRQALSLGINREELNELVFFGMGEPTQSTDVPGSPFREEEFAQAYVEYDTDRANQLLDEMGLDKRDGEGWRLMPNGERLVLPVEFFEVNPNIVPATELVVQYWKELGIKAEMKVIENSLWYERQFANQTTVSAWHEDGVRPGVPFFFYVPFDRGINYGPLWQQWYATDGEQGTEPPEEVKKQFERYEVILETTDQQERIETGKAILRSQAENLWLLGTVGKVPAAVVVSKDLGNIPGWSICTQWGLTLGEQIYFKK